MPDSPEDTRTLIDELLAEQQRLTAVDRFSRRHDAGPAPAQARYYRDLLPLARPGPGEQYAFEVDLDKCSGCKACVSACHSLNGLDEGESWRTVGLLFSDDWKQPMQQTVTTACHHCVDPGCLNGCPVLAYDKDPATGIVRHLDDQCIGCQYCVMKCPYEVPRYSARRGIVRKCDMCSNRLAVGEAPACVQACPTEAIRITLVSKDRVVERLRRPGSQAADPVEGNAFLPGSPDPEITVPSTRYTSAKAVPPDLLPGDHAQETAANPHWPLVFLLVLSQMSVGTMAAALVFAKARPAIPAAVVVGLLGLGLGSLHLGQPLKAWRAFLGWRRSWFSREVIVFGAFVPLAALAAGAGRVSLLVPWQTALEIVAVAAGLLGVACSAMLYVDTRRAFWSASQCFGRFFGTTLLLGLAVGWVAATVSGASLPPVAGLLVLALTLAKLGLEGRVARHWVDADTSRRTPLNKTARLLAGPLGRESRVRAACGLAAGLAFAVAPWMPSTGHAASLPWLAALGMVLCLVAEGMERRLFFVAVGVNTMPGKGAT